MQTDGNLVLYNGEKAVWATWTQGHAGARFHVQGDGNLVIYTGSYPIWYTGTSGR